MFAISNKVAGRLECPIIHEGAHELPYGVFILYILIISQRFPAAARWNLVHHRSAFILLIVGHRIARLGPIRMTVIVAGMARKECNNSSASKVCWPISSIT